MTTSLKKITQCMTCESIKVFGADFWIDKTDERYEDIKSYVKNVSHGHCEPCGKKYSDECDKQLYEMLGDEIGK